jgi:hypothetical protein
MVFLVVYICFDDADQGYKENLFFCDDNETLVIALGQRARDIKTEVHAFCGW